VQFAGLLFKRGVAPRLEGLEAFVEGTSNAAVERYVRFVRAVDGRG
jgi:hypothetical protein